LDNRLVWFGAWWIRFAWTFVRLNGKRKLQQQQQWQRKQSNSNANKATVTQQQQRLQATQQWHSMQFVSFQVDHQI